MWTYLLLNNNLCLLKYKWHIISKRWVCLQDKFHLHDWVYFQYTVTKNMEIYDLICVDHTNLLIDFHVILIYFFLIICLLVSFEKFYVQSIEIIGS